MEILNKSSWPPEYSLRISKKARHVHIKVIPNKGIEVVVPVRQQKRVVIEDILSEKKTWIEKHLATLTIHPIETINQVSLRAINQIWNIEYQQTLTKHIQAIMRPSDTVHTVTLHGDIKNMERTQIWLKTWLKEIAQEHLLPWLYTLSIEHGLPFNKAAIRSQQTLWGSCTAEKNISLNYKLLFVPPAYAEHIMLHELCHTKHLNHSKRFWNLLSSLDDKCEEHNHALRKADQYVPLLFN
jgi:predicted metal-dependent hydrolase